MGTSVIIVFILIIVLALLWIHIADFKGMSILPEARRGAEELTQDENYKRLDNPELLKTPAFLSSEIRRFLELHDKTSIIQTSDKEEARKLVDKDYDVVAKFRYNYVLVRKELRKNFEERFKETAEKIKKLPGFENVTIGNLYLKWSFDPIYETCVNDNCNYVSKVMGLNTEEFRENFNKQVKFTKELNNIKIGPKLIANGILELDVQYGIMVMEKWDSDLKKESAKLQPEHIEKLLNQIKLMHEKGYVHMDIRPENVLVKLNPETKNISDITLIDFEEADTKKNMQELFIENLDNNSIEAKNFMEYINRFIVYGLYPPKNLLEFENEAIRKVEEKSGDVSELMRAVRELVRDRTFEELKKEFGDAVIDEISIFDYLLVYDLKNKLRSPSTN